MLRATRPLMRLWPQLARVPEHAASRREVLTGRVEWSVKGHFSESKRTVVNIRGPVKEALPSVSVPSAESLISTEQIPGVTYIAPGKVRVAYVFRDHNQSAFGNGIPQNTEDYQELMEIAGSIELFSAIETGGQEFGGNEQHLRDSMESLRSVRAALDAGGGAAKFLRSLTRGNYGNSLSALEKDDLKKWLTLVVAQGKSLRFKVFDYNTNWKEAQNCLDVSAEIRAGLPEDHRRNLELELAIPWDASPGYFENYLLREGKLEETFKKAAEVGATTVSLKSMTVGLTTTHVEKMLPMLCKMAETYGIKHLDLHQHGPGHDIAATWIEGVNKYNLQNGMAIVPGIDVIHEGSGRDGTPETATFPEWPSVRNCLTRVYRMASGVSESDEKALGVLSQKAQIIDAKYSEFRTDGLSGGIFFTDEEKSVAGIPNGGESYTVAALESSGLEELLGVSKRELSRLYLGTIIHLRGFGGQLSGDLSVANTCFGGVTPVTPGYKRLETLAIQMLKNCAEMLCNQRGGKSWDEFLGEAVYNPEFEKCLFAIPMDQRFKGMSPEFVDALRNFVTPQKMSDGVKRWLCQTHMRDILSLRSDLSDALKAQLIEAADSKTTVMKLLVEDTRVRYRLTEEQVRGFHDVVSGLTGLKDPGLKADIEKQLDEKALPAELVGDVFRCVGSDESYHPESIVVAAGKRLYVESDKSISLWNTNEAEIKAVLDFARIEYSQDGLDAIVARSLLFPGRTGIDFVLAQQFEAHEEYTTVRAAMRRLEKAAEKGRFAEEAARQAVARLEAGDYYQVAGDGWGSNQVLYLT